MMDITFAKITEVGAFGSECMFESFELDRGYAGQDQFASTVFYGTVTVIDRERVQRQYRLVVKTKPKSPKMQDVLKVDFQFHNEILFYERILPFLLACVPADEGSTKNRVPSFSSYFYGRNECDDLGAKDMIVLKNVIPRGYRLSGERLHLDFDHIELSLKALAKFHALSYRAKHEDLARFTTVVSGIKETRLLDNDDWMIRGDGMSGLLLVILNKLTERHGGDEDEPLRRFRMEFLGDPLRSLRRTMVPSEPLAVLCHGDFNRNNLMFSYDDSGRPVDALAFDMATVRYGSPALDLSFFLYMNTDRQTRDAHWDQFLDTYCATLAEAVSDTANVVHVPDREHLDVEMRDHAFFGLMQVLFYTRVMLSEMNPVQKILDAAEDDILHIWLSFGGERATDLLAEVIQHFIDVTHANLSLS